MSPVETAERSSSQTGLIVVAVALALAIASVCLAPLKVLGGPTSETPHPARSLGINELGGTRLVLQLDTRGGDTSDADLAEALQVLSHRLEMLGVQNATVVRMSGNRILVEAPGQKDPERIVAIVGKTAKLTFQLVDDSVPPDEVKSAVIPDGSEVVPPLSTNEPSLLVKKYVLISGDMLSAAHVEFDYRGKPAVGFRLGEPGTLRLAAVTTENVGKRLAIVLDGRVVSAPSIMSPITGGIGQITGDFTVQEATELALLLNAGALPDPVRVVEQEVVKPSPHPAR